MSTVTPLMLDDLFAKAETDAVAQAKAVQIMRIHRECSHPPATRPHCLMCDTNFSQSEILSQAVFLFVGPDALDATDDKTSMACVLCIPCVTSRPSVEVQSAAIRAFAAATGGGEFRMLSEGGTA